MSRKSPQPPSPQTEPQAVRRAKAMVPIARGERGSGKPSDEELVSAFRDKHLDVAFAALVGRYQKRLYRVVLGIVRNPSLAEEVTQRSFVRAAMRVEQLRDASAFFRWLVSISRSIALDELRAQKRRGWVSLDESDSSELVVVNKSEVKEAVHVVLQQLEPDDRAILILAELEGLTTAELASTLEIKQSAAKMRLKRARDRFRHAYEELPE